MLVKIKLKNSDDSVIVDDTVYDALSADAYLTQMDFLNNLRKHSSGCVVFQKTWKRADNNGFKTETIYLHKLIAERFLSDKRSAIKNLAGTKNSDKLDCRLDNLQWRSRSVASRQRKTSSNTGYTGVYRENNRFRAVISVDKKSHHLGMFDTPEEAAEAYNRKSKEVFGDQGKINRIARAK